MDIEEAIKILTNDYEELLKKIKELDISKDSALHEGKADEYLKIRSNCLREKEACEVIFSFIGSITNKDENDWIPVNERMPKEHKQYDITTRNVTGIHSDSAIYNPRINKWFWDELEISEVSIEILAWAEKRKPYISNIIAEDNKNSR